MRILMLCEGDAETAHGSFSGSSYSLVTHLRRAGQSVITKDIDLYGGARWAGALASFTWPRSRWSVRYRLGGAAYSLRSRRARRQVAYHGGSVDAVLQIGATFHPGEQTPPRFLYCDSNIRMSERGIATGQSQAAALTPRELSAVRGREQSVYAGARGIFAISDRLRRSFIEDFGLPADRVHAVYAGPNLDMQQIPPRLMRPVERPPTILFVGVRFQRKGGDLLLRAFSKVRESIADARLLIVGPRVLADLPPGAECLGFLRKDVPEEWSRLLRAYSAADVFCLPTRYEPFGIAIVEAMLFGLPCVGPDAWAIPEMIADGETGYLFPADDESALTDRLIRLLRHPDLARSMGEAGIRRAQARFTWEQVTRRMANVISGAIAADVPSPSAR